MDNAFKFSKSGTRIGITAASDGSEYRVQIRDQGRGMTTEQINHIGLYMQFERKLYEQQGMGMGLIVAKRLIELCEGQLTMVSEPERGTTVTVELHLTSQNVMT